MCGRGVWVLAVCFFTIWLAGPGIELARAEPSMSNLSPRGLQSGATTTLTISGKDLGDDIRVLLPVPVAKQEIQPGSSAQRVVVAVTLDASVSPGIYPLHVGSSRGVSNSEVVGVDALPQMPFSSSISQMPIAMHGALTGNTVLTTSFAGKKGQRIVVDVEAQRLGSKLRPILHLENSRGVRLAWSQATDAIGGDARIEIELPGDDQYTVRLHDSLHAGASPGFFRLKIGELHFADMVFPMAVRRGSKASLELVSANSEAGQRFDTQADGSGDRAPVPLPQLAAFSGARPKLILSDFDEVVEQSAAQGPQDVPTAPVGINGRIATPKEEDIYRLPVTPGAKLRLDVWANRAGSPLDAVLVVRNEKGGQLAINDDRTGMVDPGLDVTVPGGVKAILVAIRDIASRGGNDFLYRITVKPVASPDFQVTIDRDRYHVPRDGNSVVEVQAQRNGYNGPIQLEFSELPQGIVAQGFEIPAGASRALVNLSAPGADPAQLLTSLRAISTDPKAPLVRSVKVAGANQPWLAEQIALAVVPPGPVGVKVEGLPSEQKLTAGTKFTAKVKVARRADTQGAVRLVLLTSQVVPKKKVKKDNKDVMVDDVEKALRLEGKPTIATGDDSSEVTVVVPADLPPMAYDLAIRAEVLSPDGKQVLHEATTPAFRFQVAAAKAVESTDAKQAQSTDGKDQ